MKNVNLKKDYCIFLLHIHSYTFLLKQHIIQNSIISIIEKKKKLKKNNLNVFNRYCEYLIFYWNTN